MVYIADADSKLPNLAVMRMSTYFRALGKPVCLVTPDTKRDLFNHRLGDEVYGSSIFSTRKSAAARAQIEGQWGYVKWGGTGVSVGSSLAEIDKGVDWDTVAPDYSLYSDFQASIGFLTRGCRLRCGFCVVPKKEGKPRRASTIERLYRGAPYPKHLHLLDNDAFAKPLRDFWYEAIEELNRERFKVCFSQGINVRLIDDEAARMIASVRYYGNDFDKRILYTAWDNYRDEAIFREGVARLARAGVPPHRLRVFMLVGYREGETWEEIFYRFSELVAMRCEPYVMVYGDDEAAPELLAFERWSNHHLWRSVPWPEYGRVAPYIDRRIRDDARKVTDDAWRRVVGRMLDAPAPQPPSETTDEL